MPEFVNPRPAKYDFEVDAGGKRTGGLVCKTCKGQIMAKTVIVPVWDGPFPCSGYGRTEPHESPFCPKCEASPPDVGSPRQAPPEEIERKLRERGF